MDDGLSGALDPVASPAGAAPVRTVLEDWNEVGAAREDVANRSQGDQAGLGNDLGLRIQESRACVHLVLPGVERLLYSSNRGD